MGPAFEERLERAQRTAERLKESLGTVIVGQQAVVEQVLLALLAGGHALLEGNPGLGKTLLVRTLAACLDLHFSRIQFTPDLMPSDITGTNVLVTDARGASTGRFELHRGPIFGNLVLADEINRATPKTQSALLEAMQEQAVTIAGTRHPLEAPFFVLATENPIEMEGTYPLPEAQLDRFLLKVVVPSPTEAELIEILNRTTGREVGRPEPVVDRRTLLDLQALCRDVIVAEPVLVYISKLVAATSPETPSAPDLVRRGVRYGAGVRAAQSMVLAAKARALLAGRPQAGFEDVASVALPVLRHRIVRSFEAEADNLRTDDIVKHVLEHVPERPRSVERIVQER